MRSFRLFLICLFIGASGTCLGYQVDSTIKRHRLLNDVQIFVDSSRTVSSQEIISHPERYDFKSTSLLTSEINFGFSDAVYWVKIPLSRTPSASPDWILEIPYLGLDEVSFYAPGKPVVANGGSAPVESRPFRYRFFAFPLSLGVDTQNFYLRVQSSYATTIPLVLYSSSEFNNEQVSDALIQALYYGGLLSLLFYNFILFLSVKDRQYFIYCLFTGFTGMGVFAGNGYARLYLWPEAISWDQISQNTLFGFAGVFAMIFTSIFLKTREFQPRFQIILSGLAIVYFSLAVTLIATLYTTVIPRGLVFQIFFATSLLSSIACLYGSFIAIRQGQTSAYYFGLAWGALATGVFVASLRAFEMVPSNGFTLYAVQIGSGLEMLLFSFALAYRIRSERLLREQAQSEVLQAKQSAIEAMKASEDRLERAVEERTEKLQQLLISEQEVHEQYVRFGAMIAHEFRNPLNIIEGQASMMELESESGIDNTEKRATAIRSATTRLANLFDQWLQSDRLNQPGSHLEASAVNVLDMLGILVQTSRIFHSEYEFIFNSTQENAIIQADNHLLQIAILNLIDNACKYSPLNSKITIELAKYDREIAISVSDQGCGIGQEDLEKIFNIYYRVASDDKVKGTGLGLAFVKRISELHRGRTEVRSSPQAGSTFIIWLPI